ncbi:hypothetical protein RB597_007446 [Gaeumannomyces tritici]
MARVMAPKSRDDFQVAMVCALTSEFDAIFLTFDEVWEPAGFGRAKDDYSNYVTGRIGSLNAVLVKSTRMGTLAMSCLCARLRSSYTKIRLIAVVGVCAGVATKKNGMVLGDVVISNELVQYDFGRQYADGLVVKDKPAESLGPLHESIRSHIQDIESRHMMPTLLRRAGEIMGQIEEKAAAETNPFEYTSPAVSEDLLFQAEYLHKHRGSDTDRPLSCSCSDGEMSSCDAARGSSCDELNCDLARLVMRDRLVKPGDDGSDQTTAVPSSIAELKVFVGCVGSGDSVLKSSKHRDDIVRKNPRILAFEMEGAGAWDRGACLVIKGVCDYADSHKSKSWQDFAAARAASVAKALLERLPLFEVVDSPSTRHSHTRPASPVTGEEERQPKRRRTHVSERSGVVGTGATNNGNIFMGSISGSNFIFGNTVASKSTQDNVKST